MSYYAIRGTKGVLYAIVDNGRDLMNILNKSQDAIFSTFDTIEQAMSWLNSMNDIEVVKINKLVKLDKEELDGEEGKRCAYSKDIKAIMHMLWTFHTDCPKLYKMKNEKDIWKYYYNCLRKYKNIDTWEIKLRDENESVLKNMTFQELYTAYMYAIEFKDWITQ